MLRVLVTGATGLLGGYLVAELGRRRGAVVIARGGPSRGADDGIDLTDRSAVTSLIESTRPHVIIHAAALATISDCARDEAHAHRVNVEGTANIADACSAKQTSVPIRLVHVSTDLVFDGESAPYDESAKPNPLSVYGRTKLASEREALSKAPNSVVVRTSLLFGPTRTERGRGAAGSPREEIRKERHGFFDQQVDALRSGAPIKLFEDEWRTPLSLRAAAEGLVTIASSDVTGTLHLGGPERLSRYEMGIALASILEINAAKSIVPTSRLSVAGEPRPRDVSLDSSRFHALCPTIAIASFTSECAVMMNVH